MTEDTTTPATELEDQPTPEELEALTEEFDAKAAEAEEEAKFKHDAERILGPDAWSSIKEAAMRAGVDFDGYVRTTIAGLENLEAEQDQLLHAFEESIGADYWPIIGHALGVNHTIENCRRGLMMLLETGTLSGPLAENVTQLMGTLVTSAGSFVNATMYDMLGKRMAKWTDEETKAKVSDPFNKIMECKRRIFDYVGSCNKGLADQIMERTRRDAEARLNPTEDAVTGEPIIPTPTVH